MWTGGRSVRNGVIDGCRWLLPDWLVYYGMFGTVIVGPSTATLGPPMDNAGPHLLDHSVYSLAGSHFWDLRRVVSLFIDPGRTDSNNKRFRFMNNNIRWALLVRQLFPDWTPSVGPGNHTTDVRIDSLG